MFAPGSQIGKYVLDAKLGQGGFGLVYSAHDAVLERVVALKFLKAEYATDREVVHRFLNEARSAAKIVHPGIVTVFECGQVEPDGAAFIAMELLEGETLTSRLARAGRLAARDVLEIGRQLASALGAAHRAGVVHRDLKPDNIFLVADPTTQLGERVKVLDFGIAKLANQSAGSLQTQSMMVFGTPRYMSPEQCRSAANVDARSDIYTLGCILFELLAGRPPFEGQPGELIAQHLMVAPARVDAFAPETPPALAALVGQLLAKEPEARPQTMAEVQQRLEAAGAVAVGPPPTLAEPGALPTAPYHDTIPSEPPRVATTLSSAVVAGPRSVPRAARSKLPLAVYGGAALIVLAVPVAVWFALHESTGDDRKQVAAAALAKPLPARPSVAPSAAPTVAPIDPAPAAPSAPAPSKPAPANAAPPPRSAPKSAHHVAQPAVPAHVAAPPASDPNATTNPFEAPASVRGTMSIVSKPPCEIFIDGTSVGLHTPQRALVLPVGKHRVQLVNEDFAIHDQFTVEIKPGVIERVGKEYAKELQKAGGRDVTINPFAKGSP